MVGLFFYYFYYMRLRGVDTPTIFGLDVVDGMRVRCSGRTRGP
jgi:hypothetical protein